MNVSIYDPPTNRVTYITSTHDSSGARHYTEWSPECTAAIKSWTVHPDGRREVHFQPPVVVQHVPHVIKGS